MKEETKCYCGHTTHCDCGPETLEEAFEKNAQCLDAFENKNTYEYGFKDGAKWQQERSYSEEEVWNMCNELASYFIGGDTFDLQEWFEQFKNK